MVCLRIRCRVFFPQTKKTHHPSAWLSRLVLACSLSRGLSTLNFLAHTPLCDGKERGEVDSFGTGLFYFFERISIATSAGRSMRRNEGSGQHRNGSIEWMIVSSLLVVTLV